jgi:hypothetical protein
MFSIYVRFIQIYLLFTPVFFLMLISSVHFRCEPYKMNPTYETALKLMFAVLQIDEGYMYGYVYFRQVKDKTLKRGYFQKVSLRWFKIRHHVQFFLFKIHGYIRL